MATGDEEAATLGRYQLLEQLGRELCYGVFRAKSVGVEGFEKLVVVKRLETAYGSQPRFVEAFVRAARLAMRLSHANVVQSFDLGKDETESGPRYYIVQEHVTGRNFGTVLEFYRKRQQRLPVELCLYIACEIAQGLDHAHRRRDERLRPLAVVHGNLNPRSVLVSWEGEIKLVDFCLAEPLDQLRLSGQGAEPWRERELPLAYESPEKLASGAATPASDMFSFGCLLYEMLAGTAPFRGHAAPELLENMRARSYEPLEQCRAEVPKPALEIVERLLEPVADQRVISAAEVYERLRELQYRMGARYGAAELSATLEQLRELVSLPAPADTTLRTNLPPAPEAPDVAPGIELPDAHAAVAVVKSEMPEALLRAALEPQHDVSVLAASAAGETAEAARRIVQRYGGQLVTSSDPESVVAVFGLTAPEPRHLENAVRSGLVLARSLADAAVRVAIDCGAVSTADGPQNSALTEIQDRATALAKDAGPGVAISERAARQVAPLFVVEPLRTPVGAAFRVEDVRPAHAVYGPFVGRKAELVRLADLVVLASKKRLQVVGLVGAHGIGKTRLLYEVKRRIEKNPRSIACYIAACHPQGRTDPRAATTSMLRVLCGVREGDPGARIAAVEPRLRALGLRPEEVQAVLALLGGESVDGAADRAESLDSAVGRMFASLSSERLHIFAWDNAQEIDDATLTLLREAAESLAQRRVMFLFAARPGGTTGYRELPNYTELELRELDEDDTLRLIAERLGATRVPEEVYEFVRTRAGGHPMLIEELLHEALASGAIGEDTQRVPRVRPDGSVTAPRSLRALLADRVRRLPDEERRLLMAAAVLGASPDSAVLAKMLEQNIGRIHELAEVLESRKLLRREGPVRFGFTSTLVPELVLERLEPDDRVELHRHAARAYLELGEADVTTAEAVAEHLLEAGDDDRAADYFAKVGVSELALRRPERAATLLISALDAATLERRSDAELREWLDALAEASRRTHASKRLEHVAHKLLTHFEARPAADLELQRAIDRSLGRILGAAHRYREAHALLVRAAPDEQQREERLSVLEVRIELASEQGDYALARSLVQELLAAELGESDRDRQRLLNAARSLAQCGEHELASTVLLRAGVTDAGTAELQCQVGTISALIAGLQGDWRTSHEAADRAALAARRADLGYELAESLHLAGEALLHLAERGRAYAAFGSSLTAAESIGSERLQSKNRIMLAYLDALNGAEQGRRELAQAVARAEDRNLTSDEVLARYLLGKVLVDSGNVAAARRELEIAAKLAEQSANQPAYSRCRRELDQLV